MNQLWLEFSRQEGQQLDLPSATERRCANCHLPAQRLAFRIDDRDGNARFLGKRCLPQDCQIDLSTGTDNLRERNGARQLEASPDIHIGQIQRLASPIRDDQHLLPVTAAEGESEGHLQRRGCHRFSLMMPQVEKRNDSRSAHGTDHADFFAEVVFYAGEVAAFILKLRCSRAVWHQDESNADGDTRKTYTTSITGSDVLRYILCEHCELLSHKMPHREGCVIVRRFGSSEHGPNSPNFSAWTLERLPFTFRDGMLTMVQSLTYAVGKRSQTSMPILEPVVKSLREALGNVKDVVLFPNSRREDRLEGGDGDYINPGRAREVLGGTEVLTQNLARRLVARMQLLIENKFRDLDTVEQLNRDWQSYRDLSPDAKKVAMEALLGLAVKQRTATKATIDLRTKEIKDARERMEHPGELFLLEQILEEILTRRLEQENRRTVEASLAGLCEGPEPLLIRENSDFRVVSGDVLFQRYGPPMDSKPKIKLGWGVVLARAMEDWTAEDLRILAEAVRRFGVVKIKKASEGCTTIYLQIEPDQERALRAAFENGELEYLGVTLLVEPKALEDDDSQPSAGDITTASQSEVLTPSDLERNLRGALRTAALLRPWQRLRYLFSPSLATSPLWRTIWESDERAYLFPGLHEQWKSLRADLTMTLFWWPMLTAVLIAAALLRFPAPAIEFGVLTGLALAVCGAQPCSFLISPVACGSAILPMGVFGLAQGLIFAMLQGEGVFEKVSIRADFTTSVIGGLVGLAAPAMRAAPPAPAIPTQVIVSIIAALALAIACTGWLMGQPRRALGTLERYTKRQEVIGTVLGFLTGAGIPLVIGLEHLFHFWLPQPFSFVLAFGLIGGTWIGGSTYLRFEPDQGAVTVRRLTIAILCHVGFASAIILFAYRNAGSLAGSIGLAASNGIFHSTFFTSAFVVAQRKGGVRAAFWATVFEGAGGFTGFLLFRLLHG